MSTTLSTADFLLRLATGIGCGAAIGVERQWRARMAGLRTNALVAGGATMFVLYSVAVGDTSSPTRVASYVVSGVGFLGGGVILREGFNVRGLNTAATLWCSAATGCLAASGHIAFAVLATAFVIGTHLLLRPVGRLVDRTPTGDDENPQACTVEVICTAKKEAHIRALLVQSLTGEAVLQGLRSRRTDSGGESATLRADLLIEGSAAPQLEQLVARLSLEPGLQSIHWYMREDSGALDRDPDGASRILPGTVGEET